MTECSFKTMSTMVTANRTNSRNGTFSDSESRSKASIEMGNTNNSECKHVQLIVCGKAPNHLVQTKVVKPSRANSYLEDDSCL